MPLFTYQCLKCGHVMERLEKANAAEHPICEACGSRRVEKAMPKFSVSAESSGSGGSCSTGTCPLS